MIWLSSAKNRIGKKMDEITAFRRYVEESGGCWYWVGALTSKGRGNFRGRSAPRRAWELFIGQVPRELYVCHHCDNPACVRPDHLFLGTQCDNMQDMVRKGRKKRLAGDSAAHRKLDYSKVKEIRDLHAGGLSRKDLSNLFGVSKSQIARIVRGEHWIDAGRM